ncbi:MAG: thioredoxin [Leptolyngbya sp. PLA1]|nr:thioredoxin [Leptolyngbya sp. PLA1]
MSGPTHNVLHPSLESFETDVMASSLPTLLDFWAPWCPPCLMLKPELERLAPELAGRANVAFVNVDEHPGLAEAFRVSSIPAVFVLKGGRVVDSWTGYQSRRSVLGRLQPHMGGAAG